MRLADLLEICQAFRDLGDSIGEQIADVIEDPRVETIHDQNPNALDIAARKFLATIERRAYDDDDLIEDLKEVTENMELAGRCCRGCHALGGTPDCPECGADPDEGDDDHLGGPNYDHNSTPDGV